MNLLEIIFKIGLTIVVLFFIYWQIVFLIWIWPTQIDVKETFSKFVKKTAPQTDVIATREPDKIYQQGEVVGNIIGEVRMENDILVFEKISETSNLNMNEPFEYKRDKYRIIRIERMAYLDVSSSHGQLKDALTNVFCKKIK